MALSMQELEAIRSGQATLDDIIAQRQGSQAGGLPTAGLSDAGQQWMQTQPNITDYMGQADEIYNQLGGPDQAAKYGFDDRYKVASGLQKNALDERKFGYQVTKDEATRQLNEQKFGLAENQDTREANAQAAKLGSGDIDGRLLEARGFTAATIAQAFNEHDIQAIDEIAKTVLGEGEAQDWAVDPQKAFRIAALEQYADNKQADEVEQSQAHTRSMWRDQRYGELSPDQRAKEAWMKMNDDPTAIVNKLGYVFKGPDAEKDAAIWLTPDKTVNVHGYDPSSWPKAWTGTPTDSVAAQPKQGTGRYGGGERSAEAELRAAWGKGGGGSKHALDEQILNDLPRAMWDRVTAIGNPVDDIGRGFAKGFRSLLPGSTGGGSKPKKEAPKSRPTLMSGKPAAQAGPAKATVPPTKTSPLPRGRGTPVRRS